MSDFMFREDPIAAISTPAGRGAIGIVRLSGSGVDRVLAPLWCGRPLQEIPPRTFSLGKVARPGGDLIDEVLLVRFPAPNSYTGDDMAELHCHGNPGLLAEILKSLISQGARPAQPGEFTLRAFRNGRMSLLQAESVAELIEARGEWARRNALTVLAEKGDVWVRELLDEVLQIWAPIEADMEFPTDDLDAIQLGGVLPAIERIETKISDLQHRAIQFAKLQEGYRVVLAGRPNVGKSSLLNALLGYSRALVTEIPGTTRDTLEEPIEVEGIPIRLIDTAGLGEARDALDAHGMERSRDALRRADLVVVVADAAAVSAPGEEGPGHFLDGNEIRPDCPCILAANKADLLPQDSPWHHHPTALLVSAKEEWGLDHLAKCIGETLAAPGGIHLEERLMLNQRQADTLARAGEAIRQCIANIRSRANQDLIAQDLTEAKNSLEELSGGTYQVDLLEAIFSRFCIGK